MRDMRRFQLSIIVAQVCRYRGINPEALKTPILMMFSDGINAHRVNEINTRIEAAVKANAKDDPIQCWKRSMTSHRGIQCPYDDVRDCIRSRTSSDLTPESVTIPQLWLRTNPKS